MQYVSIIGFQDICAVAVISIVWPNKFGLTWSFFCGEVFCLCRIFQLSSYFASPFCYKGDRYIVISSHTIYHPDGRGYDMAEEMVVIIDLARNLLCLISVILIFWGTRRKPDNLDGIYLVMVKVQLPAIVLH